MDYPIKVLYTLGPSQLMLARASPTECRAVKPRSHAPDDQNYASTTLKDCLNAICTASPELLADPKTDHSVYALDPLQTPQLMVGRGLLNWLMCESARVVGTICDDYIDGEEMQVLEIRLTLTPTVAVSRAQHAISLQNIFQPTSATPRVEDEVHTTIQLLEDTQRATIVKQREKTSSGWADPSKFRALQATGGHIQNGRPWDQTGLPIGFYHPVFDVFQKNLASDDPLPLSSYIRTRGLFAASQEVFLYEADRAAAILEVLGCLVGESLSGVTAKGVWADGMVTGTGGACCILMELKNEIGSGGSDPSIQAAVSYNKYWGSPEMEPVLRQSCCPSILIAIAGPWMCVLGAVFLGHAVVQPLTDFIWLGDNPQQPSRLGYVTRVFRCVSLAREELKTYYNNLPGTGKNPGRFFPCFVRYPDSQAHQVDFSYISKLAPKNNSKAIFKARTLNTDEPKDVVVKFVRTYNGEAHKLLSDAGLAPRLLYDGSESSEIRPGFSMIVMEFVVGVDLDDYMGDTLLEGVRTDIKTALQVLHERKFVFGDLRRPNVMVTMDASRNVKGGVLVDFDWCGEDGKGVYPMFMNKEVNWGPGMEPNQLMYKSHDDVMFDRLWLGLNLM